MFRFLPPNNLELRFDTARCRQPLRSTICRIRTFLCRQDGFVLLTLHPAPGLTDVAGVDLTEGRVAEVRLRWETKQWSSEERRRCVGRATDVDEDKRWEDHLDPLRPWLTEAIPLANSPP